MNWIRFRCWHKLHEVMYRVIEIHEGKVTIISKPSSIPGREANTLVSDDILRHLVIMQASPFQETEDIKDPTYNRRFIYELDILRITSREHKEKIGMVVFRDGCFLVELEELDEDGTRMEVLASLLEYELKIIGHKFNYKVNDNV